MLPFFDHSECFRRLSSSAASASKKKEAAAAAAAAAASAAAAADGPKKKAKTSSSATSANPSRKTKEDPEVVQYAFSTMDNVTFLAGGAHAERCEKSRGMPAGACHLLGLRMINDFLFLTFTQDEAEQSLRLQETVYREFSLIDGNRKRACVVAMQNSAMSQDAS
jgi:hypothetical protein